MSIHPLYINMNYVGDIQVVDIEDFIIYVWIVIMKNNKNILKNERVCSQGYISNRKKHGCYAEVVSNVFNFFAKARQHPNLVHVLFSVLIYIPTYSFI